jgi:DNA ligase-associated metallophosphoesterase
MSAMRAEILQDRTIRRFAIGALEVAADALRGLWIAGERTLVVADLHLEKGSALAARRGWMAPPYDTASSLAPVRRMIARWDPRRVIALGDSFHDDDGPQRMHPGDRAALAGMQRGRDWIWVAGNHDPSPPAGVGGDVARDLVISGVRLRHQPTPARARGADSPCEIAGHLHPCAKVALRSRRLRRPCFATDGASLVLPAVGAYAGGLNLRDEAFDGLFDERRLVAHLIGDSGLFTLPGVALLPD